jgi:hypothetical protein
MKRKVIQCKDVFEYVCTNLDEGLNSPKCRQIKEHIHQCSNCVAYLDGLKKTIRLYRECPSPKLPNMIHRQLIATLKLEFADSKKRRPRTQK